MFINYIMTKIIKSINLISLYDNEDYHNTNFDYMKQEYNVTIDDFKFYYETISLNFTDNTILNINARHNGIPGEIAWFKLFDNISEKLIGCEFIDVIETPSISDYKTKICERFISCNIVYIKNNEKINYEFVLSTLPEYERGYSTWIELISDYQVTPSDIFENNSIILLVGLPGSGKTTYLRSFISNKNYLLLDDFTSYLRNYKDYEDYENFDHYNGKYCGDYDKNEDWTMNICITTRKQIHDWLKKSSDNKVIIADVKMCNINYYNYVLRILNVYNKNDVINTILFNSCENTCELRLQQRENAHTFKYFYNSMKAFAKIYNPNNSDYINPEIK